MWAAVWRYIAQSFSRPTYRREIKKRLAAPASCRIAGVRRPLALFAQRAGDDPDASDTFGALAWLAYSCGRHFFQAITKPILRANVKYVARRGGRRAAKSGDVGSVYPRRPRGLAARRNTTPSGVFSRRPRGAREAPSGESLGTSCPKGGEGAWYNEGVASAVTTCWRWPSRFASACRLRYNDYKNKRRPCNRVC